jgi:hypothetical protein
MPRVSVERNPEGEKRRPAKAVLARPAVRNGGRGSLSTVFDFYASPSAAELASAQGVEPVRQAGDIRPFDDPDPKQAEWFVRQVRRWRREDGARAAKR